MNNEETPRIDVYPYEKGGILPGTNNESRLFSIRIPFTSKICMYSDPFSFEKKEGLVQKNFQFRFLSRMPFFNWRVIQIPYMKNKKCILWHNYRLVKAFEHRYVKINGEFIGIGFDIGANGYECNKCGRRKIKETSHGPTAQPWKEAIRWMNEVE